MDEFVEPFIDAEPDALVENGNAKIRETFPQWAPAPGGFTEASMGANAVIISELKSVAASMPRAAFRTIGAVLFKIPPVEATSAEAEITIVASDDLGYTIEAGQQFSIAATGDQAVGFETLSDIVILPGTTTAVGSLVALIEGAAGSGLTGEVKSVQPFRWIESITLNSATQNGEDAETDDAYLNRLSRLLETLAPRPILARDVPVFAQRTPGVFRVYVLDNYNPADGTDDNEKMLTVAGVDENGANLSGGTKTALADDLATNRESNFIWNIIDPTRTDISVRYWVVLSEGADGATVLAAVDAAITAYLDQARWGTDPTGEIPKWDSNATVVRRAKLVQIVENVDGVAYVPQDGSGIMIDLAKGAGAYARVDVDLDLPAPLPNLVAVTGAVS